MIEFEPAGHVYRLKGREVPHVTEIIAPLEDLSEIPRSVLEYASERGRAVHLATQLLDEADLDETSIAPEVAPYLEAYRRFTAEARPEWSDIEAIVYHDEYRYAGRLDRVGRLAGLRRKPWAVIDIKTVAQLSPVTGVQLAGYERAWRVSDPRTQIRQVELRRYALQLRPDATYRLQEYTEPSDWSVFLSLLTLANWRARHKLTGDLS